jgi:hypothetical protein
MSLLERLGFKTVESLLTDDDLLPAILRNPQKNRRVLLDRGKFYGQTLIIRIVFLILTIHYHRLG